MGLILQAQPTDVVVVVTRRTAEKQSNEHLHKYLHS